MKPKFFAHTLLALIIVLTFIEGCVSFLYHLPIRFIRYQMEYFRVVLSKSDERIRTIILPLFVFDVNGLLHEINYLKNLDKRIVLKEFTLQTLSFYVDETTFDWVNSHEQPLECLNEERVIEGGYNVTSLGNLAYIHLYSQHPAMSQKALRLLIEISTLEKATLLENAIL